MVTPEAAEQPPPWVPRTVVDIIRTIALDNRDAPGLAARLTSDLRMNPIWTKLGQHARQMHDKGELAPRLAALPKQWRLDHWGLSERLAALPSEEHPPNYGFAESKEVKLPDHALAAFAACIVLALGIANKPVTRADLSAEANEWRRAASRCRQALDEPPCPDPEQKGHLSAAAEYLEDYAQFIETAAKKDRPYYLARSSGERAGGGDDVRAWARAIAQGAQKIFGQFRYGTVATTLSVALEADVKKEHVRDWCTDLCQ